MIRPLRKRERATLAAETATVTERLRLAVALDRENQPDPVARERIVRVRALEAERWETTF